jgi:hypothetical protein
MNSLRNHPEPFAPAAPGLRAIWLTLVAGFLTLVSPALQAGSINFYNVPGNTLLQQDGVTALDNAFKFEFGTFDAGFTPTTNNITDWMANWKPFARAEAPSINGWNSSISYFNKSGILQLSGQSDQGLSADVFAAGELAYLWVYNVFSITDGGQWALATNDSSDGNAANDWLLPSPSEALPWEYPLSNALNPVWGGLHNVQGGGNFTAPLAAFTLQTHAVPEPGSVLLVMLAGVAWRIKRARR